MNKDQIFQDIKYIKDVIYHSTEYTNLSGIANILSDIFAIVGCVITNMLLNGPSFSTSSNEFLKVVVVWGIVFLLSLMTHIHLMKKKSKTTGQPVWSRLARLILNVLCPSLFIGACLTIFFIQEDKLIWIPAIWMLTYGLGLWSASMFSVKEVRFLGVAFLITGLLTLFFLLHYSLLLLAISFGGYHIIYGIWLYRKYGG